jgi:hypothetical protein
MITFVAILIFAGAFAAAAGTIYATVAPSMHKIRAALAGEGVEMLPPLPGRRTVSMRVTTVRPVAGSALNWRAAA